MIDSSASAATALPFKEAWLLDHKNRRRRRPSRQEGTGGLFTISSKVSSFSFRPEADEETVVRLRVCFGTGLTITRPRELRDFTARLSMIVKELSYEISEPTADSQIVVL